MECLQSSRHSTRLFPTRGETAARPTGRHRSADGERAARPSTSYLASLAPYGGSHRRLCCARLVIHPGRHGQAGSFKARVQRCGEPRRCSKQHTARRAAATAGIRGPGHAGIGTPRTPWRRARTARLRAPRSAGRDRLSRTPRWRTSRTACRTGSEWRRPPTEWRGKPGHGGSADRTGGGQPSAPWRRSRTAWLRAPRTKRGRPPRTTGTLPAAFGFPGIRPTQCVQRQARDSSALAG